MPRRGNAPIHGELLHGTLNLLILKTLGVGAAHGHTIACAIERRSEEVLQVEHVDGPDPFLPPEPLGR
jgi:PadR family transcriptional regulator